MTALLVLAAALDAWLLIFLVARLRQGRQEGVSLRVQVFGSLAAATLIGALLTGTYAVLEESHRTGVPPIVARIIPKAFLLGSALLALSAAGAAWIGRRLARSVEELTEAAARIADGELQTRLPRGRGREARRLARALASMRRELEGRPYAAAFLRDAWHDLKTPAAALKATVEVLEDGALEDPEAARRFLGNLRRSCDQLERTLADLVTLARFETASLAPEAALSLGELVAAAADRVRPLAEAMGVTLALPAASSANRLRGDPAALVRALGNLLENAVAASPGGTAEVSVAETLAGSVALDVVNGPSEVPAAARDKLFLRSATARQGGGSGLGLAIARAAVEAHGGRVRFVDMGPPRVRVRVELPA